MNEDLGYFETVVRRSGDITDEPAPVPGENHPFAERNIHSGLPTVVKDLFDNGFFSQATFEALKFLDGEVHRLSGSTQYGSKLMLSVFSGASPQLALTPLQTISEKDEQEGYKFLFAGSVLAIRNPRGHDVAVPETPEECLDHLSLASLLLRKLYGACGTNNLV